MGKKLVIFDMDGTLADTSQGILECHRYANVQMGRPEPSDEELSGIIGGHLLDIYKNRFRYSEVDAVKAVKIYREHYAECGINNVILYEGMEKTLRALKENGYLLAVATLKAERFAKVILENLGIAQYFDVIHGVDENDKLNKRLLLELCMNELGIERPDCVLVGDSSSDEKGALEAGIDFIAVTYGFGYSKATRLNVDCNAVFMADYPLEILEYLNNIKI